MNAELQQLGNIATGMSLFSFAEELFEAAEVLLADPSYSPFSEEETKENMAATIAETIPESKFKLLPAFILPDAGSRYHEITAIAGDDKITCSDVQCWIHLSLYFTTSWLRIPISWEDVGCSKVVGNFAEEWILTPLSKMSTFDASLRYANCGMPLILDSLKMKQLSPVRKQSLLATDLESKANDLMKAAAWVKRGWISYDHHQLAKVMIPCVFDMGSCRSSHVIFKSEGGCGGFPPWNNLGTAVAACSHASRGRMLTGINGIVSEFNQLQKFETTVENTSYLQAVHLAQNNIAAFKKFVQNHEQLKNSGYDNIEISDLIRRIRGETPIPQQLLDTAIEVHPSDITLGPIISRARALGMLMTELDVQLAIISEQTVAAITGDTPMKIIYQEAETAKEDVKKMTYYILDQIANPSTADKISAAIKTQPADLMTLHENLREYYTFRAQYWEPITSFCYQGAARLFLKEDVHRHISSQDHSKLMESIFAGVGGIIKPPNRAPFIQDLDAEQQVLLAWLRDWSRSNRTFLLEFPLPVQGTDDARIVHNILRYFHQALATNAAAKLSVIVVTQDVNLLRQTTLAMQRHRATVILWFLKPLDLLKINFASDKIKSWRNTWTWNQHPCLRLIHLFSGRECFYPNPIIEQIVEAGSTHIATEYDVANIERGLYAYRLSQGQILQERGGFILTSDFLARRAKGQTLAAMPIEMVKTTTRPKTGGFRVNMDTIPKVERVHIPK